MPAGADVALESSEDKASLSPVEVVTFILSLFVLAALLVEAFVPLTREARELLDRIDFYVCLVFLAEFAYNLSGRLARAPFCVGVGLIWFPVFPCWMLFGWAGLRG